MQPRTKKLLRRLSAISVMLVSTSLLAQSSGITRTIVTKADSSIPGKEDIIARIEIAAGAVVGWHTHPGDEISYVTDGEAELLVANQAPRKVKAGEGFVIPAGVVHSAKNHGSTPIKLVGVYVLDKDKPLASPAPAPASVPAATY
ncbi:cupin domain-containing protein [Undibacterium sp. Ji50W]|uniref:cupin domain-containing protein n=1 Tax=Undibacterium sp. Ji50W TaxID=3413041 RepID=UPI003BF16D9F